jgi:hypothetical protein
VDTIVAKFVMPTYGKLLSDKITINARTSVNRSSKNVEVGLVLDVTGSMGGQRIADLKTAAAQLVDIVVQPIQSPYTTRMAIIPFSVGVNMGSTWAADARGPVIGSKPITDASWAAAAVPVNAITQASPGVVTTASSHGLNTNDFVWVYGVTGMTTINNKAYRVVKITDTTFSLQSWNGSSWATVNTTSGNGYAAYMPSAGDNVRKCQVSDCTVVITSNAHGIPATTTDTGSTLPGTVYITGVGGMTQINNRPFEIANVTANSYSLVGVIGPNVSAYTSGGLSWCGQNGCQYRAYRYFGGSLTSGAISTCVTERVGAQAYTDAAPSTAFVGRFYGSGCPTATIQPLTDNVPALKAKITSLAASGGTAGHIGLAWGWYSIAPNFNGLWPASTANAYDPNETIKSVIMMTDGDFNTEYCSGVQAPGACNATNGTSFAQATALCTAMKARGVVVYSVGFQVASNSSAANFLRACATDPSKVFFPGSGAVLTQSFAAIGRDITRIRISQ